MSVVPNENESEKHEHRAKINCLKCGEPCVRGLRQLHLPRYITKCPHCKSYNIGEILWDEEYRRPNAHLPVLQAPGPPPFKTWYEKTDIHFLPLEFVNDPRAYFFYPEIGVPHQIQQAQQEGRISLARGYDVWNRQIAWPIRTNVLEPAEPTPIEEDEELPQIEPVIVHDNTPQEHVLPKEADTAEGFQAGRSITTHVLTKEGPQQSKHVQNSPSLPTLSPEADWSREDSPPSVILPSLYSEKCDHRSC